MMNKIMITALILITVSASMCLEKEVSGTYEYNYYGTEMKFASNLEEAQNITVLPDDATLRNTIFSYDVATLQIGVYQNDTEAPYTIKSLVGFSSKYAKMSLTRWDYDMTGKVNTIILNDTSQVINATAEEPAILIMGPAFGQDTKIVVEDNVVKVYAKDLTAKQGKYVTYNDLDLALDKIILVLAEE